MDVGKSVAHGNKEVIALLDKILQAEMTGIARYLHYSFMIMGHNRIPIQKWFRDQAQESMDHSILVGEKLTSLGGHPAMVVPKIEESNVHTIDQILTESLVFEEQTLGYYKELVRMAGDDIALEEMAREFCRTEQEHIDEVRKMIRSPK